MCESLAVVRRCNAVWRSAPPSQWSILGFSLCLATGLLDIGVLPDVELDDAPVVVALKVLDKVFLDRRFVVSL